MKISQEQLKKIIKEELAKQLQEDDISEQQVDEIFGKLGQGIKKFFGGKSATQDQSDAAARAAAAQVTQQQPVATQPETQPKAPASTDTQIQTLTQPKQVPVFKATPDSKGDVLSMRLKPLFSKVGGDQILTQYLKMISNQLKANGVKLMEANLTEKGENLSAQLGGFKSKTAQDPGTAANIQKGSVDLFGPAVMLLKQTNPQMDQKTAVTLAKQIQDITSKHLQKYGVNLPQKAIRVPKPVAKPTAAQPTDEKPEISGLSIDKRIEQIRQIIADPNTNSEVRKALAKKLQSLIQQQKAGTNFANMEESKKPVSYNKIYNKWQKIIKG